MTKARDISSLIGSSGQIDNTKITLDANEIPALDTAKITTGTFADARISSSSVSQHAQSFDDNKLVNDISTLALRQASDENKSAYNTNSSSVDVFQDSNGITNLTNTARSTDEFITSVNSVRQSSTMYFAGGSTSNGGLDVLNSSNTLLPINQTNYTQECWGYLNTSATDNENHLFSNYADPYGIVLGVNGSTQNIRRGFGNGSWQQIGNLGSTNSVALQTWYHYAYTKTASGVSIFWNGNRIEENNTSAYTFPNGRAYLGQGVGANTWNWEGYITEWRISNVARYTSSTYTIPTEGFTNDANTLLLLKSNTTNGSSTFTDNSSNNHTINNGGGNITHSTAVQSPIVTVTANATGSFENNAITAPSSVSSMGAIITYQDNAGTNALNTDIVLQLSADGGSNYSTATLTALPDFSTGIKMAKVNDLAVTAGTNLKYKISFANQALGSKEARIRGVALQY